MRFTGHDDSGGGTHSRARRAPLLSLATLSRPESPSTGPCPSDDSGLRHRRHPQRRLPPRHRRSRPPCRASGLTRCVTRLAGRQCGPRQDTRPRHALPGTREMEQALVVVAVDGIDVVGMALAEAGRADDGAGTRFPGSATSRCFFSFTPIAGANAWVSFCWKRSPSIPPSHGHTQLQLSTRQDNHRAQRFYERAGFRPSGRVTLLNTGEPVIHLTRASVFDS